MNKLFLNKKGSALVYVMFGLVIILFMISIMVSITLSNTRQASEQETGMQAYYIARSGVESAYEALLTTSPSLLTDSGPNSFRSNSALVLTDTLDFENGTADIKVTSNGSGSTQKILIESVGTMKNVNVSRNVSLEFYLQYDVNPDMIWSR